MIQIFITDRNLSDNFGKWFVDHGLEYGDVHYDFHNRIFTFYNEEIANIFLLSFEHAKIL